MAWQSSTRRALALGLAAAAATLCASVPVRAQTAPPASSAIGNEAILSIAVSPLYQRTGLVVVQGGELSNCSSNCARLWISRDGGSTWHLAAGGGTGVALHPVVAVTGSGHEVLIGYGDKGIQRSDDDGDTWRTLGSVGGMPAPEPSFAQSGLVAVAAGTNRDYLLDGATVQPLPGSGGVLEDTSFGYSPAFPQGSAKAPAALVAGIQPTSHLPAVASCSGSLACSAPVVLPGTTTLSGAPNLHLSSTFDRDGTVFARTETGIYRSTDGGATFTQLQVGAAGASQTGTAMMALASGYSQTGAVRTAYAAVLQSMPAGTGSGTRTDGGIYRSTDGGTTWARLGSSDLLNRGAIAVAVAPDGRLFAGYLSHSGGLLCSADGGRTWQPACPPLAAGHGSSVGGSGARGGQGGAGCTGDCGGSKSSQAGGAGNRGPGAGGTDGTGGGVALAGAPTRPDGGGSALRWIMPLSAALLLAVGAAVSARRRRRGARDTANID